MSTEFFNDQWRMPSNENQNKVSNYSMDFDGTSEIIRFGDVNGFDRTDAFSGSCWVNLTGSDNEFILSKQDGTTTKGYMLYVNVSRYLILYIANTTTNRILIRTNSTVSNNNWNHLAFTYDGSSTSAGVKLYINGVNQSLTNLGNTSITGSLLDSSVPFQISGRDGTSANGINGKIDQVSIFDYALSQDQVTQLGAEGYAFNFIPNDYIGANTTIASNLDFSVSAWINPTSYATVMLGTRGLASAGTSNGITMNINSSGNLWARIFTETSNVFNLQTGGVIALNSWSHVAMTYDSSTKTLKSYLNGTEAGSMVGADPSVASTADLNIGRASIGTFYDYFDGEISNISVFNTGLTGSQVTTLYNSGKPLTDMSSFTSLQGWWKLDDTATFNSGTSVWSIPDASSNSNTGTSVGMNASNLVASNINGELIANPMATSPKPIAYYQLGDQSVDNGANYLVPNNSLGGYVFNFGATNESINLGEYFPYPSTVTDPWSVSFWVKLNSSSASGYILSSFVSSNGFIVSLRGGADIGMVQATIRGTTSAQYTAVKTNNTLSLNDWKHVVVTYDGNASNPFTAFTIYITGNPIAYTPFGTNAQSGSLINSSNKYIGQRENNSSYLTDCDLSQLSFFHYELSSSQVDTLYNNGVPGDISSLNPKRLYELNDSEIFNTTSTEWSVDNNAYPSVYKSS